MPVITLTSDWNLDDFYVAAIKGRILSNDPTITIVDINHKIKTFNTAQAAFILRNAFQYFPPGSIHLILVNTEAGVQNDYKLVKAKGHFFIGMDNGIFSIILGEEAEEVIQLIPEKNNLKSFPELNLYAETAIKIAKGISLSGLGKKVKEFQHRIPIRATIEENGLTGSIIYIDSYENAITNISQDLFERVCKGREFEMYVQSKYYKITKISNSYNEVSQGELLALFNAASLLEIAINGGNAASLLNLDLSSSVRIEFIK